MQDVPPLAEPPREKARDFSNLAAWRLAQAAAGRVPVAGAGRKAGMTAAPTPGGGQPDARPTTPSASRRLRSNSIAGTFVSTVGYNGTAPGPVLRMQEGKPVTVDVINATDTPELVHWHGMLIPPEVDGTEEEGSPFVPPHGRQRFQLTPGPAGSRWYHSHAMAMDDLHKGAYTGQFGFVYVEGASDPGHYDQELFLAVRDWEPFFTGSMDDMTTIPTTARCSKSRRR